MMEIMTNLSEQEKQKIIDPSSEELANFMQEAKVVEFLDDHEQRVKKNMEDLMKFMRS
jgi:hypothetical protein